MKRSVAIFSLCIVSCCFATAQSKSALLIGIDIYNPAGTTIKTPDGVPAKGRFVGGFGFPNLLGPTHDIDAMRAVLTSEKFGFPNDDQHIHVLRDSAATHDGILAAMRKYLVDDPKPNDTVVFYISSHGSLRVNSKSDGQVYDLEGTGYDPKPLDNTLVAADAYLGAEDILNRDLRRLFNQAAEKGIHLIAIIDACHSGGQARGAPDPKLVPRNIAYDPRDLALAPDTNADGSKIIAPEDRKVNPVLVLSAAQKDQSAMDVQGASPPHGLFTHALVQALEELPAGTPAIDIFRRVSTDMEIGGANNQQPALDSTNERKHQPLFGGDIVKGPLRAAVISVDEDGILLDVGAAADIGAGSEFTQITAVNGVKAVVSITKDAGIARSRAQLIPQPKASIHTKDLVELTKWVPAARPEIHFDPGKAHLPLAVIQAATTVLSTAGFALVNDPSADPWTHIVSWNGAAWTLQKRRLHAGMAFSTDKAPQVLALGAPLTAAALSKGLTTLDLLEPPAKGVSPVKTLLWFNPPLPAELLPVLLTDKESAAQLLQDTNDALYVAAGNFNGDGLSYAWFERGDFEADVQTPSGYGRGCSPNSPYPLRTDWVPLDGSAQKTSDAGTALTSAAVKLAKINGWLKLQQSSVGGNEAFPYHLRLQRQSDKQLLMDGDKTYKDDRYSLALSGSIDADASPRWVYVLGIDCQGSGQLVWPTSGVGGRFPTDSGRLATIPLPDTTFRITPPYGTDTFILLTTSTPLPEPDVLNFDGVVRGGTRGMNNPLENLLKSTSSASRGFQGVQPTDWGVDTIQLHSQPTRAPQSTAANVSATP